MSVLRLKNLLAGWVRFALPLPRAFSDHTHSRISLNKSRLQLVKMVVLNGDEDVSNLIPFPRMNFGWNDNPVEEHMNHEEWKIAIETLLPRLLRPRQSSEDTSQHKRENSIAEDSSISVSEVDKGFPVSIFQHYAEAIRDFGRWLSSFGSLVTSKLYRNPSTVSLTSWQMKDFLVLLERQNIRAFLESDHCRLLADSYLIAIVFTYFVRAGLTYQEYNEKNFFAALTLAHEIEEENYIFELFVINWETESLMNDEHNFVPLHQLRYELFTRMNFRALVSRKCCEEVMSLNPDHWAWNRRRLEHHSGVFQERRYPNSKPASPTLMDLIDGKLYKKLISKPCNECSRQIAKTKGKSNKIRLSLKRRPVKEEEPARKIEKKFCP